MTETEDFVAGDAGRITRGISVVGMRLLDIISRRREEQRRREAEGQREAAAALQERQNAQRQAATELIKPALDPAWRDAASDRELATAYVYAEAYSQDNDLARIVQERLGGYIQERHGDLEGFVDTNVDSGDLERVPAPTGQPSATQERAIEAREQAALDAIAKEQTRYERILAVAGDERADAWANQVDVIGRERADRWLQENLGEDELAELAKWEQWDEAERERGEAAHDRHQAAEADTDEEREQHEDSAAEHDANATEHEERGDMEREGSGQFPHSDRDLKKLESTNAEAAEALRRSKPGRQEALTTQVAEGKKSRQGRARTHGTGRDRDRQADRGR